jgi:carbonic anhydrase
LRKSGNTIASGLRLWFPSGMRKIIEGIRRFRRETYPQLKPRYDQLVTSGQKPKTLMIGCSDSRVAFETLTGCGPGELFIVRNAGNIVPHYGTYVGGVTASIEFAVTQLPIEHIIVCGHTHCGAIRALLNPETIKDAPAVRDWVNFSSEAADRVKRVDKSSPERHVRAAIAENVILQMENLRTFPCLEEKLAREQVRLHGWVYEIENGDVVEYDEATKRWLSLTEPEGPKRDVSGRFRPVD